MVFLVYLLNIQSRAVIIMTNFVTVLSFPPKYYLNLLAMEGSKPLPVYFLSLSVLDISCKWS